MLVKFITSSTWKNMILILSAVFVVVFVMWRLFSNNYIINIAYVAVHIYQIFGILICHLMIEKDEYFSSEKVRWIEIFFFGFIATPYTPLMFILNTRDNLYGDPEDSPCAWLVYSFSLPLILVAIITPLMNADLDTTFWMGYILMVYFYLLHLCCYGKANG